MKNYLIALLLTCFAILTARADLIWYESFNYPDGSITNTSAGLWIKHSGINNATSDSIVKNHKLEISGNASTNAPRQDDIHRNFCISSCTYTSSPTVVCASFTINCTNLPTGNVSNYIAHFYISANTFQGRMFGLIGSRAGTWRLGVSATNNAINKVFPVDLAPNTDYQVVLQWDPVSLFAATLWVNPISQSDLSVSSNDTLPAPATANAFAFRQAAGTTSFFCAISNLALATSWDEAVTNVWATNAVDPVVLQQPKGGTNFVGAMVSLVSVANGQGLASLTYQWRKDGVNISNSGLNTNVFTIPGAAAADSGNYDLVVSTAYGLSATSAVAFLWVTNPPVPPNITLQPTNQTVYFGQGATFHVVAGGSGSITFQWFYAGAPASGPNFLGADSDTLTVLNVQTNNGTTGDYRVDVTNPFGTTPVRMRPWSRSRPRS